MLSEILQGLQNPVPDYRSLVEYYEQIWETDLLMCVDIYGYLQFKSVLMALEDTDGLLTALEKMGIRKFLNKKDNSAIEYSIAIQTANTVLDKRSINRNLRGLYG